MHTILAIDTSTANCSVALRHHEKLYHISELTYQDHSAHILPMIDNLLGQAQCDLSHINFLAFGQGPGSFTGLRLTCSIMSAFNCVHNTPVIGVSTLAALASQDDCSREGMPIVPIIGSTKSAMYVGQYIWKGEHLIKVIEEDIIMCERPAAHLQNLTGKVIGCFSEYHKGFLQEKHPDLIIDLSTSYPQARDILLLAEQSIVDNSAVYLSGDKILPTYQEWNQL